MDINNCDKVIFKATNVVAQEIDSILDLIRTQAANNTNILKCKRINCDVSNILHILAFRHSSIFSIELVHDVARFLKRLAADSGFVVTAVLDGNFRPQSKRDAFKRRFDSTMNRINSYYCRQAAMKITGKGKETMMSYEKEMLKKYNNEAKVLEMQTKMQVPFNFFEQLEEALEELECFDVDRESGGYVSRNLIKAEFEADYMIAYRFRNGLSDIIYSTDSDMSALCGVDCISIHYFGEEKGAKKREQSGGSKNNNGNHDDNNKTTFTYNISGGSNKLMNKMEHHIRKKFPSTKIMFKEAKYPLLETTNPLTIAAVVVGIGCDVIPGGISGVTPLALWNEVEKMNKDGVSDAVKQYMHLVQYYLKKDKSNKLTETDICTFCQAFLYQPALEFGKSDDVSAYKYIHHKPISLPSYLKMFLPPGTATYGETGILRCKGISGVNPAHDFLRVEGSYLCSSCHSIFCKTCGYSPSKDRDGRSTKKRH